MTRFIRFAVLCTTFIFSQIQTSQAEPMAGGCTNGNCYNGYGTYQFANGNRYIGNFAEGQPHGDGILYCANGNKYLGSWEHSWRQGKGRYVFQEGHEYIGELHRNQFQGEGTMTYSNGDRYEGAWKSNQPNGFGKYFFKNTSRYEGDFQNGRFHGKGTMNYPDGSKYVGLWQQSKQHGEGTFYDVSGMASTSEWLYGRMRNGATPVKETEVIQLDLPDEGAAPSTESSSDRSTDVPTSSVRIWAVVVGVATYTHMPTLRYTDDDAYQFYAFLKSPGGGALPDDQVRVLIDDSATKDNILGALRTTMQQADENDVVLFYFSGHGVEGAFVPVDFDGYRNRLEHEDIMAVLEASKARHKVVLGDACHSGSSWGMSIFGEPLASRAVVEDMLEKYYQAFEDTNGGTALLMSSKGREVSLEDTGLRSGVFSHFLIRGLKGEADFDFDGIVTIDELFEFTNAKVGGYTAGAQTPVLTGSYDEKMPIGVVRK